MSYVYVYIICYTIKTTILFKKFWSRGFIEQKENDSNKKQNRSTEGCSKLRKSVDMTSLG